MPELPEVEVLRRTLEPHLVGDLFEGVEVRHRGLREPVSASLGRDVAGGRVTALRRRAKYLLLDLDNGRTLVVHLGMSGRLTLCDPVALSLPHEHLCFRMASGRELRFRDPRRFGLVFVSSTRGLLSDRHFRHLGAEPLEGLSGAALAAARVGRRGPVKAYLMDARVIVGVGNIYACESLWRAGVHPCRSVARIAAERWDRLASAVVDVLEDAISQGGTTLNDFADGLGEAGYFQVSLAVYGRQGKPCPRCRAPIRRARQQGRSTFYCIRCQR